mmetsp:Transcript_3346/g.5177  ORF Transcript_3346/g.5177 Transcript_3346/m.5177 type:complete len:102 (+) Transcript_3346:832-1137(+)
MRPSVQTIDADDDKNHHQMDRMTPEKINCVGGHQLHVARREGVLCTPLLVLHRVLPNPSWPRVSEILLQDCIGDLANRNEKNPPHGASWVYAPVPDNPKAD